MDASQTYLETQVNTATPQRLRLMLIDGALRKAKEAAQAAASGNPASALEPLSRCRSIVTELIAGIRAGSSPLADQVLQIYLFLFQELSEAQLRQDLARIDGVIRVLEEERITWQELCLTLTDRPEDTGTYSTAEIVAPAYLRMPASSAAHESVSFDA